MTWKFDGTKIQRRFQRFQLSLAPAYAFTDYKCQGRTLEKAIIDLSNTNTYNSKYVMLSRIRSLNDLLILRPFNESILNIKLPTAHSTEIKRLEKHAEQTKELERWPDEHYNHDNI
ncbi:9195_t:CDS:1, partial [Cetraspora pellucida]